MLVLLELLELPPPPPPPFIESATILKRDNGNSFPVLGQRLVEEEPATESDGRTQVAAVRF